METMVNDELGFGSVDECQGIIGVACAECEYAKACIGDPEPVVEKYMIGMCMSCGNDFEVNIMNGDDPVLMECCPDCGCKVEWNEWSA